MYVYVRTVGDNKYYSGTGAVKSTEYENIETNSVPFDESNVRQRWYKLVQINSYNKQTVHNVDKLGEVLGSYDINIPVILYTWEFDETAFNSSGEVVEKTDSEKILELQQANTNLTTKYNQVNTSNGMILLQLATLIASANQ